MEEFHDLTCRREHLAVVRNAGKEVVGSRGSKQRLLVPFREQCYGIALTIDCGP